MDPRFVPAARVAEVPDGRGLRVEVEGRAVALFRVRGALCAVTDTCPHRGASLGEEGRLDDEGHLVCAWHHWTFDPRSGIRVNHGDRCLLTYPVRVEDGIIFVGLLG